jgi:uncharacterized protein YkwD
MKRKKLIIIISSGVIVLIILGVIIYLSLSSKRTNVAEKNMLGEENFEENLVIENVITNEIEENAISEENIVNNEVQESSQTDETTVNQDNNQGNTETKQENKPIATTTNVEQNKANSENKDTKAQSSSSSSSNNNNQKTQKQETKTTAKSETKQTTTSETKKQTQVTSSTPEHMQSWESRAFAQVNKIRKANGSDAITWDNTAYQEALRRAKDNANKDAVIDENGISVYSLNDNETPEGLINKFKSSSGHMQSLKDKKIKKGAVAVYKKHTNLGDKYYGYVALYEGYENTRKYNYEVDM